MDLKELIRTRRTVHNYRPETVSDTLVREAWIEPVQGPNHRLSFPWVYVEAGPRGPRAPGGSGGGPGSR